MKAFAVHLAGACVAAAAWVSPVKAQVTWGEVWGFQPPPAQPAYAAQRLAKQGADECFNGIGVDYPPLNPDGTCSVGIPKKNQAYVWGLTEAGVGDAAFSGDAVWFGTMANPICDGSASGLFPPEPNLTVSWVCEYGESMLARRPSHPLPASLGDWRMPHAYSYNPATQRLTDRTPSDPIFLSILGLRSAGAVGSAVLLAGPTFQNDVAFAAWDASTGTYLGSCRATALNQIRQWITVNGVLYAGAGRPAGDGVILRWNGTVNDPFHGAPAVSDYCGLEVVGVVPAFPAYLANYGGKRLAVSAWNKSSIGGDAAARPQAGTGYAAGIYLGPPFGADGQYTASDAGAPWLRLWAPAQYETDPVVASTTGGGAIAYWNGWLWFGSMQNNQSAALLHSNCSQPDCYGPPANASENIYLTFNVSRAASIWRARVTSAGPEVQLLYGQTQLPALVPNTKTFAMKPTGWTPLYGQAGFDNPFATYTWSVSAGPNDLLFGMYDYRYVFDVRLGIVSAPNGAKAMQAPGRGGHVATTVDPQRGYGGDLWRFTSTDAPALPENLDGLANWTNYGFRNMLRLSNGGDVIVGTASGLNLEPDAGWELQRLSPLAGARPRPAADSGAAGPRQPAAGH